MNMPRIGARSTHLTGCLSVFVGIAIFAFAGARELAADEAETNVIPADVAAFATIKFDEAWQSPAIMDVRKRIMKEVPNFEEKVESFVGLKLDEIKQVSVFLPAWPSGNTRERGPFSKNREPFFGVLITAKQAYNPVKLLKNLDAYSLSELEEQRKPVPSLPKISAPRPVPKPKLIEKKPSIEPHGELPNGGPEETEGKKSGSMRLPDLGAAFYASKRNGFLLYPVNERSYLILPLIDRENEGLFGYLGLLLRRSDRGNLTSALALAEKNQFVVGINLKEANKRYAKLIPDLFPGRTLLDANSMALTTTFGKEMTFKIAFDCSDDDTAQSISQTVSGLLTIGREALPAMKKDWLRDENMKDYAPLLDQFETSMRTATCRTIGKTVNLTISTPSETLFGTALASWIAQTHRASERMLFLNNFKQMALAIHNYHDVYGNLPFPGYGTPAKVKDKSKVNLSWRVAILPFLEQEALYRQFDQNEPWDGPNNKKLIAKMPKLYAARKEIGLKEGETLVQTFTGPKAIPPHAGFAQITDGLSNTFMLVEAGEPVIWTKPDDIPFDPEKQLPKLGGNFNGDFVVSFGDGYVRFMERKKLTDQILKLYIMPNDGQPIPQER